MGKNRIKNLINDRVVIFWLPWTFAIVVAAVPRRENTVAALRSVSFSGKAGLAGSDRT